MPPITDWYAFAVGIFVGLAIVTMIVAILVLHEIHLEARCRRDERRTFAKHSGRHS